LNIEAVEEERHTDSGQASTAPKRNNLSAPEYKFKKFRNWLRSWNPKLDCEPKPRSTGPRKRATPYPTFSHLSSKRWAIVSARIPHLTPEKRTRCISGPSQSAPIYSLSYAEYWRLEIPLPCRGADETSASHAGYYPTGRSVVKHYMFRVMSFLMTHNRHMPHSKVTDVAYTSKACHFSLTAPRGLGAIPD
jgi:hypothetical protein